MEKKFSDESQAGTRQTRPLDDTVEGEAVIPELTPDEVRKRTGGKGAGRHSQHPVQTPGSRSHSD